MAARTLAPRVRRLTRAAVLCGTLLLCWQAAAAAQSADCTYATGARVMLESDATDPDVFLWDSRGRLVDYAAGQWGNTHVIFAHTILAKPGTPALVVACEPAVVHPRFSTGDEDALGVKILGGPYHGRYGWVLSSDAHAAQHRGQTSAQAPRAGATLR